MKQSRVMSFLETSLSTAVGFVVALCAQMVVFPLFGFHPALSQNLAITLIFTVVSIIRQFILRRVFEALHIRRPLSPAMQAVIAERFRQIEVEGWSAEHDNQHEVGEIARAGAAYAIYAPSHVIDAKTKDIFTLALSAWPWSAAWWKPQNFRRDLVRAAALILAELEKFDRNRKRKAA